MTFIALIALAGLSIFSLALDNRRGLKNWE